MKRGIKKITMLLCFIAIIVLADDCSSSFYHDKQNPCTKGSYYNTDECDKWKKNFPHEYERYIKRSNSTSIK